MVCVFLLPLASIYTATAWPRQVGGVFFSGLDYFVLYLYYCHLFVLEAQSEITSSA